jgi:hypothetical protein
MGLITLSTPYQFRDNEEPISFLRWVELVKGRLTREFPDSHEIIIGGTAADREAHIQRVHSDEPARAAAWNDSHAGQGCEGRCPALSWSVHAATVCTLPGRIVHLDISLVAISQLGSNTWADTLAAVELRLEASERVGAFGQRAELRQQELADVG